MILFLKDILKYKKISSIALADGIGVSKTTVSYWLNGKVFPTPDTLVKIAEFLNMEVWQLFKSPSDSTTTTPTEDFLALMRFRGKTYTATTITEAEEIIGKIKESVTGE